MEPQPKRPRSEFDGSGPNPRFPEQQQRPQEWVGYQQRSGDLECRRFKTPEGCPNGSTCRFRHVPNDGRIVGQQPVSSAGKPKPCMKFFSTSGCPFGESCHFLHYLPGGLSSLGLSPVVSPSVSSASASQRKAAGPVGDPSVTVNGYKKKLCNRFNTPEGCRFGDRCHFAHGESDLRRPNNMPRGNSQPVVNGPMSTAPPGFSSGSDFSNPIGYQATYGNATNFIPQAYAEPNQPGVAGNNAGPVNYQAGAVGENVPVY